jgi:hypothetical protein
MINDLCWILEHPQWVPKEEFARVCLVAANLIRNLEYERVTATALVEAMEKYGYYAGKLDGTDVNPRLHG